MKYFDLPKEPGNPIVGEYRFIDIFGKDHSFKDLPIGTMFPLPVNANMDEWPWFLADKSYLSDYYFEHNKHRRPLFVVLPKKVLFVIDGKCNDDGVSYGGWQVTGVAPNITVSPSINIRGAYHGWLQNGVISEDVEGQ
jgi:hypothetical protein